MMDFLQAFQIHSKRESDFMRRPFWFFALVVCSLSPLTGPVRGRAQAPSGNPTPVQPAPATAQPAPSGPPVPLPNAANPDGSMPGASGSAIRLDIVVTDHEGASVPGLTAADFSILDNNQPSKILSFHAYGPGVQPTDPPVQVIILFDTVNTDFDSVSYTRQQVENFLRQNGGHLAQPVSLVWLTNTGIEPQGAPTLDGNALATALDGAESRLRTINRSAGAYGAIERFELSSRALGGIAESELKIPGRKLLIWAGPGWPMLDGPNINISNKGQQSLFGEIVALSTLLREAQIDLYSVAQGLPGPETFLYQSFLKGVKKASQSNIPNLGLKVIAVQSGGLVIPPSNDLTGALATCVRDAPTYYTVSFEPPPADGPNDYHKLDVHIDKPGLTARTNTGYYDQPPGPAGR
jgi:VWFA-related protein